MGGRRDPRNKQESCPLCGCEGGRPWSTKLSVLANFLRLGYLCQASCSCLLLMGCKGCLRSRITPQAFGHNFFPWIIYPLEVGRFLLLLLYGWSHCHCSMFGILTPITNLFLTPPSLVLWYARVALPRSRGGLLLSFVIAWVEGVHTWRVVTVNKAKALGYNFRSYLPPRVIWMNAGKRREEAKTLGCKPRKRLRVFSPPIHNLQNRFDETTACSIWYVPVVPHKAVAQVPKIGHL